MVIESLLIVLPFMVGLAASTHRAREVFGVLLAMEAVLILIGITLLQQPLIAAVLTSLLLSATSFGGGLLLGSRRPRLQFAGLSGVALICGALVTATLAGELKARVRKETVQTVKSVEGTADAVWSSLKSFDSVSGERTLLMRVGLRTPQRCELEDEAVGARRTCKFDRGSVEQLVTQWKPPRQLDLQIGATELPVQLFNFTTTAYRLSPDGERTDVLRTTEFESRLVPAWLWRPLERRSIDDEHRFLLAGLPGQFVAAEEEPGVAVRITVKTNPPTMVTVVPPLGSKRRPLELGRTPLEQERGAYVGDTILLVNEEKGIRFEEPIYFGQPGELKVISKVFNGSTKSGAPLKPTMLTPATPDSQPMPWAGE